MRTKQNKNVVSAIAVAGIMSLGVAPAWAQQSGQMDRQQQQQKGSEALISAAALKGSRVMDQQNREIGELSNLFIDPQTGRVTRADIQFSGEGFGTGDTYSVAWDKMSVKRQGDQVVVALDQAVIDSVQQRAKREGGQNEKTAQTPRSEQLKSEQAASGGAAKSGEQAISADQMSSEQIRKVQQQLNQQGFHAGSVDGKWSSQTQSAIRNFQQSKGIQATGELDRRTLNELGLDADEFRKQDQPESKSDAKPSGL